MRTSLTTTSLLVRYTMCILLTPVLYIITTVIIEVYRQCFTEWVSLRYISKPTSRAEISSPISLYIKAVKGAHLGSALTLYRHRWSSGPLIEKKTVGTLQTCFFYIRILLRCAVILKLSGNFELFRLFTGTKLPESAG